MLQEKEICTVAETEQEILATFPIFQQLRPKLQDQSLFLSQILRQKSGGYILVYLKVEDEVAACMGFRSFETLAWNKILYIDDLIVHEKFRKRGLAKMLIEYAVEWGKNAGCQEIHLDSGYHRLDAHRFYLNQGFSLYCHHFSLVIS